jgi:hypothetical protein
MKDNFEEQLTRQLKSTFVEPSSTWESKTLDNLSVLVDNEVEVSEYKHLTINNYLTLMNKKNLILGGISLAALSLLVILTVIVIINRLQNNNNIRTANLSEAELQALYTKIADANPTFNTEATVSRNSTADADMEAALSSYASPADTKLIAPYYGTENVLYTNKYVNKYGPAVNTCSTFGYYGTYENGDTETTESHNIMSGGYINNVTTVTRSGDVVTSYYSNISNETSNTSYEYQGGKFAVKFNYPVYAAVTNANVRTGATEPATEPAPSEIINVAPDSAVSDGTASSDDIGIMPTDLPQELSEDPATRIKQLFGENATIIGTQNENGKDYYVVQSSYDVNCSEENFKTLSISSIQPTTTNTAVNHFKIDPESYLVVSTTTYLDTATENNMISESSTTTSERAVSGFGEVSNLFAFPYSVPVREVTIPEYKPENEINKTRTIIQDKNIDILKPNNTDLIVDSVTLYDYSEQTNYYGHTTDRDFYPDGAVGDRIYDMYTGGSTLKYDASVLYDDGSYYPNSLGYVYFNSSDFTKSLSYTIYEDIERNYDNLLAVLKEGKESVVEAPVTVSIDGTQVNAVSMTYTYSEMVRTEGSTGSSIDPVAPIAPDSGVPAPTNYSEVLIRYNGMIYQISSYSADNSIDINTLAFTTLTNAELESVLSTMLGRYSNPEILY